jgi:hypothetical protein
MSSSKVAATSSRCEWEQKERLVSSALLYHLKPRSPRALRLSNRKKGCAYGYTSHMGLADLHFARSLPVLEMAGSQDGPVERRALDEIPVSLKLGIVVSSDGFMSLLGGFEVFSGLRRG